MKKAERSNRYKMWNQTRLARHVHSWFHAWDALGQPMPDRYSWAPGINAATIRNPLYQSMIVHLDFITTKQGVGLEALIQSATQDQQLTSLQGEKYLAMISRVAKPLFNIRMQRNNVVAHRSKSMSFREVREAYPVTRDDLAQCSAVYHAVSYGAYNDMGWFTANTGGKAQPWELDAKAEEAGLALFNRLTAPYIA